VGADGTVDHRSFHIHIFHLGTLLVTRTVAISSHKKKNATVKPFVVQRKTFKYVVSSPVKPLFLVFHIKGR
jgi:hypothetical protein